MKKTILTALALAGAAMCILLAGMSAPDTGETVAANWCAPTEHMDCGYVLSSQYAKLGPVSAAQLGLAYFAFLAVWFGLVGVPNHAGRAWRIVPLALTALGAMTSAWFIYIMAVKLPVWCPWCIGVHVVNGLLFVLVMVLRPAAVAAPSGTTAPAPQVPHPTPARACGVIGGALGLAIILILGNYALFQQTAARMNQKQLLDILTDVDYCVWNWQRQPLVELPVRADDPMIGPADAPMTAVVFIDFECPHCRELHHFAKQTQTVFPGRVRFVFKHYPMNSACNPNQRNLHRYACEAALAAEAARSVAQGDTASEFRGLLFESINRLASRPYVEIAGKVGIPVAAFEKAMADRVGHERITEDVDLANRVGVIGSGKMFLNGRRLDNWVIASRMPGTRYDTPRTRALWERLLGMPASMPATQPAR